MSEPGFVLVFGAGRGRAAQAPRPADTDPASALARALRRRDSALARRSALALAQAETQAQLPLARALLDQTGIRPALSDCALLLDGTLHLWPEGAKQLDQRAAPARAAALCGSPLAGAGRARIGLWRRSAAGLEPGLVVCAACSAATLPAELAWPAAYAPLPAGLEHRLARRSAELLLAGASSSGRPAEAGELVELCRSCVRNTLPELAARLARLRGERACQALLTGEYQRLRAELGQPLAPLVRRSDWQQLCAAVLSSADQEPALALELVLGQRAAARQSETPRSLRRSGLQLP